MATTIPHSATSSTLSTPTLPPDFTLYQTSLFQVALPPGWQPRDLATLATDPIVQQLDRKLPPLTRVISTSVALPIAYGWAGQTAESTTSVTPAVIIQGIPLGVDHRISFRKLPTIIYELYRQPDVSTDRIERNLVIDQHDAAKLRSTILLKLNGTTVTEVETYHYFIESERMLWVLTYLIDPHRFAQLNPLILQSAKSFHSIERAEGS
jgi:hypothetical protein